MTIMVGRTEQACDRWEVASRQQIGNRQAGRQAGTRQAPGRHQADSRQTEGRQAGRQVDESRQAWHWNSS